MSSDDRRSGVRVERGPHGAVGIVESGAGRAGRDAEDLGDLDRLEAREMPQHEEGALLCVKSSESPLELVAIGDRQEVVAARCEVVRQGVEVGHETALTHRLV